MLDRLVALIVKELQALLRDPQSRRLLILPVVLQVALFPFAATLEVKNSTLAVLNQDMGAESVELIQRFARAEAFPHLLMLRSEGEMREVIDAQRALIVVQFPADFSRKVASGGTASLQAIIDGRRSNSAQIAFSYAQSIVSNYAAERAGAPSPSGGATVSIRHAFNPNLDYRWFIVPSLVAIITTLGCLIVTALSVAREREQGTFDQLLVSPLTPGLIMIGKAVPALLVAVVQATLIILAAVFLYHVPLTGSLTLLYVSMLCYGLALVGFGLLISSICATQQQAFLGVFCFMMPAILLSGFMAPVENMPDVLRALTWIDPLRHFIVIVKGIFLKDFDLHLVAINTLPLIVIAASTLTAAYWMFRRRIE